MTFAIIRERKAVRLWVRPNGPGGMSISHMGPPDDMQYANRDAAERDAEQQTRDDGGTAYVVVATCADCGTELSRDSVKLGRELCFGCYVHHQG